MELCSIYFGEYGQSYLPQREYLTTIHSRCNVKYSALLKLQSVVANSLLTGGYRNAEFFCMIMV